MIRLTHEWPILLPARSPRRTRQRGLSLDGKHRDCSIGSTASAPAIEADQTLEPEASYSDDNDDRRDDDNIERKLEQSGMPNALR
jgi:hypothetical protein